MKRIFILTFFVLCSLFLVGCDFIMGEGGLTNPEGNDIVTDDDNSGVKQNGSVDYPYLISSVKDLKAMSSKKGNSLYFKMTCDIDLESNELNLSYNYEKPFSHHFDGNGFSLKNLKELGDETVTYSDGTSLFDVANGATFENVKIVDGSVRGRDYIGGLVGQAINCTFNNCSYSGSITASNECGGGIAGRATECTFTNCKTTGEVLVYRYGGGIIGKGEKINMSKCSSSMNLTSDAFGLSGYMCGYMGGIIGSLEDDGNRDKVISECFASGKINQAVKCVGGGFVGGLIGSMTSYTKVENCYATGDVENIGYWNDSQDKISYYGGIWKNHRNPAGALIGGINYLYDVNIINCFASGSVTNEKASVEENGFGLYCKTSLVGLVYDNFTYKHIKEEYKCPSFENYRTGIDVYKVDITVDMLDENCSVHLENNYCVSDFKNTYTPCNYILRNYLVYKSMPTYKITNNISESELKIKDTFVGFDFENVWEMSEDHPVLKNNK